jgi:ssRNA-specific RNase YbeY (16S rRNA maturation enzyme)
MISVEVIVDDGVDVAPPFDEEKLRDYAAGVLGACGVENCEVNVVFIDDCTMEELNGKYRSRSGTTDVLSFTLTVEGDSRLEGEG